MTVYEAVVLRLAMLGYEVTDNDKTGLEYLINKCEKDILANINQKLLPDGLFYTLVDMVAGHFMYNKKPPVLWRALTLRLLPKALQRVIFLSPLPVQAMAHNLRRHALMPCLPR